MITIALAIPAVIGIYLFTGSYRAAAIIGAAFIFGGLMFGPDLDTVSRPYTRWGPARVMWTPYRHFFPQRSRFSHGLLLGAFIRVVYLLGCLSIIFLIGATIYHAWSGGGMPAFSDIAHVWRPVGRRMGTELLLLIFIGLWAGAASHTITDMAGSFIKTGRAGKFF